ncbi:hypothetical protein SASPL_116938 [Salvia splendens]|uniref:Pectinesterase inhibitor domain-containing protein n=1 Tax=Salvia splendens TaxID=180675 RepID=A0A8X8XU35_SALSN|nr:hypothetical protein SASPL_116938 [Salvia splendens]
MAKMVVLVVATLLVFGALIPVSSAQPVIGYPVIGGDLPKPGTSPPADSGNPYHRGCTVAEQCRGGGGDTPSARKLLTTVKNVVHGSKKVAIMAKTVALMFAALFVMTALFSSSEATTGIDYSALVPKLDIPTDGFKRACQALHGCRGNRKLLSDESEKLFSESEKLFSESEKSISEVVQATGMEAENLKFKFLSLFH